MNKGILLLIAALFFQPLLADSASDKEDEMNRAREKEAGRARDTAAKFADQESFTKSYEYLKKANSFQFASALEKRKAASKAWQAVADGMGKANTYDQISALKAPAYDAEAIAELARLELRAAGSEKEWKKTVDKSGSKEVAAAAALLLQNQNTFIQTTKQYMASQKALRQIEIERNSLEKKMREAYEASKQQKSDNNKKPAEHNSRPPENNNRPPANNGNPPPVIRPPSANVE
jgi:hypothetical protein